MSSIINLLLVGGKFLTKAAAKTIQEAFLASIRAREYLAIEYEKFSYVIEPHEHMLELIQDRSDELSQLIGSEVDIHVAVIDSNVKVSLDSYFSALSVPYIHLKKSDNLTPEENAQKGETVLLTVNPKSSQTSTSYSKSIPDHNCSTKPADKDLELLKQQIRDKFKKLVKNGNEKSDLNQNQINIPDIAQTVEDMLNARKYLLRDLNHLLKCLGQIDDLQKYIKLKEIKNNTIHVLVVKDNTNNNASIVEIKEDPNQNNPIKNSNFSDRTLPQNMGGNSRTNKLFGKILPDSKIPKAENINNEIFEDKLGKSTVTFANRKRKHERGTAGDNQSEFPIKNELQKRIKNSRTTRLYEDLLDDELHDNQYKNERTGDSNYYNEFGPMKLKHEHSNNHNIEEEDVVLRRFQELSTIDLNIQPQNVVSISDKLYQINNKSKKARLKETIIRKLKGKKEYRATVKCNTIISRKFHEKMHSPSNPLSQDEDILKKSKPIFLTGKQYKTLEKHMKKRVILDEELEREQKFLLLTYKEFYKLDNHLTRMKRLEEHVFNETKCMFMNKRHFRRLEKRIKFQILKEKEGERERQFILLSQQMFDDLEKRLTRQKMLAQIQNDIAHTSQVINANYTAFNMFQRRMLHSLVNTIDASKVPPINTLCGKEIGFIDKTSFNMIVDKIENYTMFNSDQKSINHQENYDSEIAPVGFEKSAEEDDIETKKITEENIEPASEFEGLRVSVIKDPDFRENDGIRNMDTELGSTCAIRLIEGSMENDYNVTKQEDSPEKELNDREPDQKVSEFIEVNEKVFNDFEKVQKTVRIIDQKPKFSVNKSEDDSGKLLLPKNMINEKDKRNISTIHRLCNKNKNQSDEVNTKTPCRCKSDTTTSVVKITNTFPNTAPLYSNLFDKTDENKTFDANKLSFTDILGKSISPKSEAIVSSAGKYANLKDKTEPDLNKTNTKAALSNSPVEVKNFENTNKLKSNIGNSLPNKDATDRIKHRTVRTAVIQVVPKSQKTKQIIHMTENTDIRKHQKVLDIYKKHEYKYQVIDRKKLLDDILFRQENVLKQKNTNENSIKYLLHQRKPSRDTDKSENRSFSRKNDATKQNKLIIKNSKAVTIDRNLERKLVGKDIQARASLLARESHISKDESYKKDYSDYKPLKKENRIQNKSKTISKYLKTSQNPESGLFADENVCKEFLPRREQSDIVQGKRKLLHAHMKEQSSNRRSPRSFQSHDGKKQNDSSDHRKNSPMKGYQNQTPRTKISSHINNTYQKTKLDKNKILEKQTVRRSVFLPPEGEEEIRYQEAKEHECENSESLDYSDSSKMSQIKSNSLNITSAATSLDQLEDQDRRINASLDDIIETIYRCDAISGASLSMEDLQMACKVKGRDDLEFEDNDPPRLITSENCRDEMSPRDGPHNTSRKCKSSDADSLNLDMELMDEKDIILLLSKFATSENNIESQVKPVDTKFENSLAELHEPRSEIVSKKFDRKPWGTNVINQTPSHIKKIQEPDILPQTTIWNNHPKSKVVLPPKQKNKNRADKKYRYHTKEIVMGNKVTKVTYLVEE